MDQVDLGSEFESVGAEAGQPSDADEVQTPAYVTAEQFAQELAALRGELRGFAQSLTDKAENRLQKAMKVFDEQLTQRVSALRQAGYNVTDDMVEQERQNHARKVLAGELEIEDADGQGEAGQPAQAATAPDQLQYQARVLSAQARAAQAAAEIGFGFVQSDPELAYIRQGSPEEWADSYVAALQAKAKRLGRKAQGGVPPVVRTPSSGGAGLPPTSVDQKVAELTRLQNKSEYSAADLKRMRELEAELLEAMPKRR